jgi:hypothetical protein
MYTNTIADVGVLTGSGHGGTYAFVGPGWHGTIPRGVVRIDVPTPDAWLLGRTQVKGSADLLPAVDLEAKYSISARYQSRRLTRVAIHIHVDWRETYAAVSVGGASS